MKKLLIIILGLIGLLNLVGNVFMQMNYNPETGQPFSSVSWDATQRTILVFMAIGSLFILWVARFIWKENKTIN